MSTPLIILFCTAVFANALMYLFVRTAKPDELETFLTNADKVGLLTVGIGLYFGVRHLKNKE